jgi:tRNA(fMet)-specific endonuclease VapC
MALRYLLDTNIFIYIRRGRPTQVMARFARLQLGEAALSVITYGELLYGVEKKQTDPQALERLEELVGMMQVIPLPPEAGRAYGELRAGLETRGEIISNNDLWIAAHALAANLTLVTNNEREFRRIAGLKIENWAT